MDQDQVKSAFSDEYGGELENYRRADPAGMIALVLGLASWLGVLHPLFTLLSVLGLLVALVAAWRTTRPSGEFGGAGIATIAVIINMASVSYCLSAYQSRSEALYSQAESFAEEWLALVQAQKLDEAHQFTLPRKRRRHPEAALDLFYANHPDESKEFEFFVTDPPMAAIVEYLADGEFVYDGRGSVHWERGEEDADLGEKGREFLWDTAVLRYHYRYMLRGEERLIPFELWIGRATFPGEREAIWRVIQVARPNET